METKEQMIANAAREIDAIECGRVKPEHRAIVEAARNNPVNRAMIDSWNANFPPIQEGDELPGRYRGRN